MVRKEVLDRQRERKKRQEEKKRLWKQKQREINKSKKLKERQKAQQDLQELRELEEQKKLEAEVKEKTDDFCCPHCSKTIPNLRKISMEERKKRIVEKYGVEPTICFYYYLWNAIEYAGEENVRLSFESIKGQGDEILVVDYGSTDGTVELCEEFGFKVIHLEKEKDSSFRKLYPTSKMTNAIIKESKSNFLVNLNVHTKYRSIMDVYCRQWIAAKDVTKEFRIFRGNYIKNGFIENYGASCLIYKPFLLEARGYDERTYYSLGTEHYFIIIMLEIFDLIEDSFYIGIIHNDTKKLKLSKLYKMFDDNKDIKNLPGLKAWLSNFQKERKEAFEKDFDEAVKGVVNSYW